MTYRILQSGHIELREETETGFHRRVIAPNEPIPTEYQAEIEADESFELYRTQENADAYEQSIIDSQPTEAERLEQWRLTFSVELYKLKITLENKGDLEAIESIIASQPKQVQIAWENTPTVRRNSPTVASLAITMNYTDEVLDQLFKDASEVVL